MKKRIASPHPIRCSFCGRGQDEVARLVSGPSVYICSECVKLCNDILEGELEREQLNGILAHHTRQPLERIERDTDRNFFMSADEAKDYGIVDHVINKRADTNLPTPAPVQVR